VVVVIVMVLLGFLVVANRAAQQAIEREQIPMTDAPVAPAAPAPERFTPVSPPPAEREAA
jgi:hypothetical protein